MEEKKKFVRDTKNAMLAGVCAGIANYFSIDITLVRILFVVFTFFGGPAILVYLILWVIAPRGE